MYVSVQIQTFIFVIIPSIKECPYPVYTDESGSRDYCYFLADPALMTRPDHADLLCSHFDLGHNSSLAVLDTEAKCHHVQESAIFTNKQ